MFENSFGKKLRGIPILPLFMALLFYGLLLIESYDKQREKRFLLIFQVNASYFRSILSPYFSVLLYYRITLPGVTLICSLDTELYVLNLHEFSLC